MAEGLILVVLQKITATLGGAALNAIKSKLGKEAGIFLEAENSMKEIESEFEVMQAFISQVDPYSENDKILKSWLKHVRKIASEVEDIIDEYAFLVGKMDDSENFMKKTFYHSKNVTAWKDISAQLNQVKARIQHLTTMKKRYGIKVAELGGGSSSNSITRQVYLSDSSYLSDEDDEAIIGNEAEVQKLTHFITEDGVGEDRTIISIWGMGGSGKTTLASSICRKKEIRKKFDCYAWVTVSPNYHIEDLLTKVMMQLGISDGTTDATHLMDKVNSNLRDKRYLIVLDDMWNRDSWLFFDRAFVKNRFGSKVIITTRIETVASLARENHTIKIGLLPQRESWKLFSKKACSKQNKGISTIPEGLVPWANKILERCQGLPLAIVAIGSLLSYREMEEQDWRVFYYQLNWQLTNNPELNWVSNVLKLSLDDLPSHLRNCFLYCGLFPEDYQIRRKWIIRLWVAEGFVEDRGTETTLEEVAEDYLKELTQRSLIQVTERNEFGRPKRFQVHDLVREMALAISRRESFALVCNQSDVTDIGDDVTKRVSVHVGGQVFQPSLASQHLRSFLLFDKHVPIPWIYTASSNFRLLRVLCLRYSLLEDIPDAITSLFNLHYLDFSRTRVRKIPKSVASLKKLQTLHLRFAYVRELPREITMLTRLRHLSVSNDLYGTSIPANISSLKHLQTLREVKANKDLAQNLGYLTQLRSLGITGVQQNHNDDLWVSIKKMTILTKLAVATRGDNEFLSLQKLRPLRNLEKLYLTGRLAEGMLFPVSDGFQKLKVLTMCRSGLVQDPLGSLCQMVNLVYLNLQCAYDGESLVFSSGWFPKLKQLYLLNLRNLSSIQISEDSMASLTYLQLLELWNLKEVPEGIKHLRSLEHLYAQKMPKDFVEKLEGDCRTFVEHIASIECV